MPRLPLQRPADTPASQPSMRHASPPIAPASPAIPTKRPFTARQQAFIDNYVVSKNASDAALKAGYSEKTAGAGGHQALKNIEIRAEIDRRLAAQAEKLEITADRIRSNLADIANGSVAHFIKIQPDGTPVVDFSGMTPQTAAALASVTVEEFKDGRSDKREVRRIKFSMADRVKANELLGRHFGLFAEQFEHKHTHEHTLIGHLLLEIDAESRGPVVVEHEKGEAA